LETADRKKNQQLQGNLALCVTKESHGLGFLLVLSFAFQLTGG